ncbi:hydrogenase maturation protease [Streptomyces sp. SID8379]|uniref:hydrogenase maturation protease n=1 Tax=unclassified Streptomyces TaxID=2593676 RepID=UPI0005BBB089|nr:MULTISPECIES: hydrogenase maturation protease [unclassified Streptomyces]MYW69825.1 hydrogenase maturation protease [Streptomyces sp. SID8379]
MDGSAEIAIIGVGNDFRHDDGVGWAVVAQLRNRALTHPLPAGTRLETCDGDPGRLLGLWEHTKLSVVLDAAHADPPHPGRIHRLELDSAQLGTAGATSSHGLGLGEAIELSRVLGRLPGRLVVYAVEGADRTVGSGLSGPVAAQVVPLANHVGEEIARFRSERTADPPRRSGS